MRRRNPDFLLLRSTKDGVRSRLSQFDYPGLHRMSCSSPRKLFTAKDHSWIILLGMLSQEFRQSMEAHRAVSSTRGYRRVE
jgi:hypothetical protein